jgi:hypothetical protein
LRNRAASRRNAPGGAPVGDVHASARRIPVLPVERQIPALHAQNNERELRRHIDLVVGRALVDRDYAVALLADSTLALKALKRSAHPLRHSVDLPRIHALSVEDFACQALELFSHPTLRRTLADAVVSEFPPFAA